MTGTSFQGRAPFTKSVSPQAYLLLPEMLILSYECLLLPILNYPVIFPKIRLVQPFLVYSGLAPKNVAKNLISKEHFVFVEMDVIQ